MVVEANLSLTDRTQSAALKALNKLVRIRFPQDWKDVAKSGVAQGMLTAVAWMHGQRSWYYDWLSINAYLQTCETREACRELCKGIGYTMRPASSASVAVRAYPDPVQTVPVTLRKGETLNVDDLVFEVTQDYTIPANKVAWPDETTTNLIVLSEGKTQRDVFTSDGGSFQEFDLSFDNVIDGSVRVYVVDEEWELVQSVIYIEGTGYGRDYFTGDGADGQTYELSLLHALIEIDDADIAIVLVNRVPWLVVPAFTGAAQECVLTQDADGVTTVEFGDAADGSAPGDGDQIDVIYQIAGTQKRLEISYDDNDRGKLTFGDGQAGLIPPDGAQIVAEYRVGGGTRGNIPIGALDTTIRGYLPDGKQINVRLYNYEPGSGGEPRESLDHAKYYAPRVAKSNDRVVRKEDFDALGSTYLDPLYGAPAYASASLKQEKPELNEVLVAVWSRDSRGHLATAQTALKEALRGYLQSKRVTCVYITMTDGTVIFFRIGLGVSLLDGFYADTVFTALDSAIQSFFDSALVKPGDDLSISQLYDVIQSVPGVYRAVIDSIVGTIRLPLELAGDGSTTQFQGQFVKPDGLDIVTGSVRFEEPNQETPEQSVADDGNGNLVGDVAPGGVNTVDYESGIFDFEFTSAPATGVTIYAEASYVANLEWSEDLPSSDGTLQQIDVTTEYFPIVKRPPRGVVEGQTVNFYIPDDLMPVVPGRCFFVGGYGTGEIIAFDDGEGNIFGDVDPLYTNKIDYETGEVDFKWNAMPPYDPPIIITKPGVQLTLTPAPDGTTKSFSFAPSNPMPIMYWTWAQLATWAVEGRLKLDFATAWPASGFSDVFDNWQGRLNSVDLDWPKLSQIEYAGGTGRLEFLSAPPNGLSDKVVINYAPVTQFLYGAFVFYVKTQGAPGHDRYLYADNEGRLWGQPGNAYPVDRLIHKTGHLIAELAVGPVPSGRTPTLSYDAWLSSKSRDLPVNNLQIAGLGQLIPRELAREINL